MQAVVVPGTVPNFNQGKTLLALYNPDGTPFVVPEIPLGLLEGLSEILEEVPKRLEEIPEPFVLVPAEDVEYAGILGETPDPDLVRMVNQFNALIDSLRAAGFLTSVG